MFLRTPARRFGGTIIGMMDGVSIVFGVLLMVSAVVLSFAVRRHFLQG